MPRHRQNFSKANVKDRFKRKYLSRMQASRLLQLDSMQFRRLCILKGIYPRSTAKSKQKDSGNQKQYYLTREIKWLVRDQINDRIAAYRSWQNKVKRAKAMHRFQDLEELQSDRIKPKYTLDATIKERYPFFLDALRDMDDCLSMLSLYSFLTPEVNSNTTIEFHHALPTGLKEKATQCVKDWMSFATRSGCLSRAFISVKGYYYECFVNGEKVLWLMPHEFASKFPEGIQQYVLISFLEFYCELSRFVLFKLNRDLDKALEAKAIAEDDALAENAEDFNSNVIDSVIGGKLAPEGQAAKSRNALFVDEQKKIKSLFHNFVFYLSREVPQKHCSFVIAAAGGRVATEYGPSVTHYIVDRPALLPPHTKEAHIEYLQPQWLWDSLNARLCLPAAGYRMGETLPPHVSPFTVALTNSAFDKAVLDEVKKDHPAITGYVAERVHEIRRAVNPTYEAVDPDGQLEEFDEGSEASEIERLMLNPDGDDDDVSVDDDAAEATRNTTAWEDEKVVEHPERTGLSAYKVKKQRELNLMNKPTDEAVASRKADRVTSAISRQQGENRQQRAQRKMKEAVKEKAAKVKGALEVARKKTKKFYNMVSAVEKKSAKINKSLSQKAKNIVKGKAQISADGKKYMSASAQKTEQQMNSSDPRDVATAEWKKKKMVKQANPYKHLPKHVQ